MTFDLLLFDLDGTLYDQLCGYEDEIHSNIFRFMVETTGGKFDAIKTMEEAKAAWRPIFQKYNLTKRGLIGEGYKFDGAAYDRYIRKGAEKFIRKDPDLRIFLESLPQRKIIFTNAPEFSAHEILGLLGVEDLFDAVLGSDFFDNKICKPECEAFKKMLQFVGVSEADDNYDPKRICYFEDSYKNLMAGKKLGFTTVFVSSTTLKSEGRSPEELHHFDAVVERKVGMNLREQIPELFTPPKIQPVLAINH